MSVSRLRGRVVFPALRSNSARKSLACRRMLHDPLAPFDLPLWRWSGSVAIGNELKEEAQATFRSLSSPPQTVPPPERPLPLYMALCPNVNIVVA